MRALATTLLLTLLACGGDEGGDTLGATTVAATTVPATAPATDEPMIDWASDLAFLDAGVRGMHPNPFWRVGEEEWNAQLAEARELMPTLGRRDAEMMLLELTALIDGHSGIFPEQLGYRNYALRLYHFADGFFVLDADDLTAIGGELVAINGVPVERVVEKLRPLIPHDNDQTIELLLPMYMLTAEILEGVDIVADLAAPGFDVLRADGSHVIINPALIEHEELAPQLDGWSVGLPQAEDPLSQSRRNENFWWTMVDDVLYFQYNQVQISSTIGTLSVVVAEMRERLEVGDVRRVVVDLRHNPGGNNRTYRLLLQLLLDPLVDRADGLYVIIGRQTFSAATNFATELDVESDAVFVGEPTGGSPNLYGDTRPVVLPSSGISVRVSERYWEFGGPGDTRPWIPPDVPVELNSADYFAGIDPVLQAALDA